MRTKVLRRHQYSARYSILTVRHPAGHCTTIVAKDVRGHHHRYIFVNEIGLEASASPDRVSFVLKGKRTLCRASLSHVVVRVGLK